MMVLDYDDITLGYDNLLENYDDDLDYDDELDEGDSLDSAEAQWGQNRPRGTGRLLQ